MSTIVTKALAYIDGIKLTITQFLLVTLAAIIGIMAIKLRIQGAALHKARVTLLSQGINLAQTSEDSNLEHLRELLNQALLEYKGTL
jgi:hypothetical protein